MLFLFGCFVGALLCRFLRSSMFLVNHISSRTAPLMQPLFVGRPSCVSVSLRSVVVAPHTPIVVIHGKHLMRSRGTFWSEVLKGTSWLWLQLPCGAILYGMRAALAREARRGVCSLARASSAGHYLCVYLFAPVSRMRLGAVLDVPLVIVRCSGASRAASLGCRAKVGDGTGWCLDAGPMLGHAPHRIIVNPPLVQGVVVCCFLPAQVELGPSWQFGWGGRALTLMAWPIRRRFIGCDCVCPICGGCMAKGILVAGDLLDVGGGSC